ncbi:hypothetical protein [Rhodococcus sp. LB1]|uniref:hypothetical protein n=1 Tax=Rhodococcus sp. LB1 TaxID=1807499 RepID=UPI00077A846A|nr:hypothetical protein [Rhodococcus sp. LB1]KXX59067.1 hypothetical protein AZG88_42825 [Rhodococcus sp. LB1]
MTTINTNEAALGIESFGDNHAPVVALAGRTTMPSWPDALSDRPAACGRRAVRYYPTTTLTLPPEALPSTSPEPTITMVPPPQPPLPVP